MEQVGRYLNSLIQIILSANLASNGQLYFLDTEEARRRRMSSVPSVKNYIISAFDAYLQKNHQYVQGYLTMKDMLKDEERRAASEKRPKRELKLLFSLKEHV